MYLPIYLPKRICILFWYVFRICNNRYKSKPHSNLNGIRVYYTNIHIYYNNAYIRIKSLMIFSNKPPFHKIFDKFPNIAMYPPHDGASRCPWKRTRGDGRCTLVSWCVIVNPKRPPITTTLLRVISTAFDDSARPAIGTTEPKPTTAADEGARFADRVLSQLVFIFCVRNGTVSVIRKVIL